MLRVTAIVLASDSLITVIQAGCFANKNPENISFCDLSGNLHSAKCSVLLGGKTEATTKNAFGG